MFRPNDVWKFSQDDAQTARPSYPLTLSRQYDARMFSWNDVWTFSQVMPKPSVQTLTERSFKTVSERSVQTIPERFAQKNKAWTFRTNDAKPIDYGTVFVVGSWTFRPIEDGTFSPSHDDFQTGIRNDAWSIRINLVEVFNVTIFNPKY